jgi:sRNA-binding protein
MLRAEARLLGMAAGFLAKTTAYLKAVAREGSTRSTIDGEPAGEVSDEHRDFARRTLEAWRKAGKERAGARAEAAGRAKAAQLSCGALAASPGPPVATARRREVTQASAPDPFRRGLLSADEIAKRKAALSALLAKRA